MRTETKVVKIYKFDELSDEAKESAVMKLYDINVSHEWCDHISEDLKQIDCELSEFDTDRGNYCKIDFSRAYIIDVATYITKSHSPDCETTKIAKQYLDDYKTLHQEDEEPDLSDINKEFIDSLQEEYLSMLRREYEYLTSEEAIIETIEANGYEFTVNGDLY